MKKEYINPELCVIEVETQGMLAASQVTSLAPGNSADLDFEDDTDVDLSVDHGVVGPPTHSACRG